MEFKLGELFCGPGGLGLGAVRAKINKMTISHEWASDYDADSCATYQKNIAKSNDSIFCCDVADLDIEILPKVDAFAYGFPCNDFSIVGEQKGFDGKFGGLYKYGVDVINHHLPQFFVAENVSGLSSANSGEAFHHVLKDLTQAGKGYRLTVHQYKAEDYGVPQTRHRIIIVGIAEELGLDFRVPAPTTSGMHVSAKEALENPPIPISAPNQTLTRQSSTVVERLKHIKPGENAWNSDLPKHLQLNVKGAKLSQIYRRLHPDKPSYTITGSGGGGTHGYHWKEPRALTNRERARLQTFPDDFEFCGSKESIRKQIGMAVPPLLSQQIFTAILKTFSGEKYPSIPANQQSVIAFQRSLF